MDKIRSEMPFMDEFGMVEAFATFPHGHMDGHNRYGCWGHTPAILFGMCFDLHHKHDSGEANEYSKVVILLKI